MKQTLFIITIPFWFACLESGPVPDQRSGVRSSAPESRMPVESESLELEPTPDPVRTYIRIHPDDLGTSCSGPVHLYDGMGQLPPVVAPLDMGWYHPVEGGVVRAFCPADGRDLDFDLVEVGTDGTIVLTEPTDLEWVCARIAIRGRLLVEPYYGTLEETWFHELVLDGEFYTGAEIRLPGAVAGPDRGVSDVVVECRDEYLESRSWPRWVGRVGA